MKKLNTINKILVALFTAIVLQGCASDESLSRTEKLLKKLSHTWELTSAKKDNVTMEGYDAFELTLSGSSGSSAYAYGVSGRPELSPWPAGGMWEFGSDEASQLIRDPGTVDEVAVEYEVTDATLEIRFQFDGTGYEASRIASASGTWVFSFSKQ